MYIYIYYNILQLNIAYMLALQYPRLNIFSEILSRISLIRKLTNKKLICLIRAGSLVQLVQVLGN